MDWIIIPLCKHNSQTATSQTNTENIQLCNTFCRASAHSSLASHRCLWPHNVVFQFTAVVSSPPSAPQGEAPSLPERWWIIPVWKPVSTSNVCKLGRGNIFRWVGEYGASTTVQPDLSNIISVTSTKSNMSEVEARVIRARTATDNCFHCQLFYSLFPLLLHLLFCLCIKSYVCLYSYLKKSLFEVSLDSRHFPEPHPLAAIYGVLFC